MSGLVIAVVLLSACTNASWNAVVKNGGDKLYSSLMVSITAALAAAALLLLLPAPAPVSWPYLACSTVAQLGYYALLAATYHRGDMSHAYPLMRGTAPFLVAVFSVLVLGESLGLLQWAGILLICGGVLVMALHRPAARGHSVTGLALATACTIATYTLIDGHGVRLSGSPLAYALWTYVLTASCQSVWLLVRGPKPFFQYVRTHWKLGVVGGGCSVVSYTASLWAMALAPVALVAALRETSILFATAISALILRERITLQRLAATCVILAGALTLRLS